MAILEFITSNKGKLREVSQALAPLGYGVVQVDYGYPEIQADTHEEVATFGMDYLEKKYPLKNPILIDDSGLFIEALKGFPGVYSKHALMTIGCEGILKLMASEKDRRAYFECMLAYKEPGKDILFAHGKSQGQIALAQMPGTYGFGFDPIFLPYLDDGRLSDRSFSQLEIWVKNRFSHRGRAVAELVELLRPGFKATVPFQDESGRPGRDLRHPE